LPRTPVRAGRTSGAIDTARSLRVPRSVAQQDVLINSQCYTCWIFRNAPCGSAMPWFFVQVRGRVSSVSCRFSVEWLSCKMQRLWSPVKPLDSLANQGINAEVDVPCTARWGWTSSQGMTTMHPHLRACYARVTSAVWKYIVDVCCPGVTRQLRTWLRCCYIHA
jgi:hypothetical protein